PALHPALDDESCGADEPDRDERVLEARQPERPRLAALRMVERDRDRRDPNACGRAGEDRLAVRTGAARETGADRADEDADGIEAVRRGHEAAPGRVLD